MTGKDSSPWKECVGGRIRETFKAFIKRLERKDIGHPLVSHKKDEFNDEHDIIEIMNCIIKFIF